MSLAGDPFQNPHEGFTAIQEKADSLFHRTVDLFSRAERTEHNGYDFSVRSTSSGGSAKDRGIAEARAYGPSDEFVETPKADFGETPTLSGGRGHLVSPTYVARDGPRDEREVQEKRAWWGGMEDRDPRDGDLDSPRLAGTRADTPTKRRGWSWFGRSASTEVADDGKHHGGVQRRRGWFNWSRSEQDEAEAAAKVRDLEQDPKRREEERHFLQRREDELAREEAEVRRLRATASSSSARSASSPSSSTSQSHRDASAPGGIFAHRAEERAAAVRRAEDIARDARISESAHEIRHHTGVAEHRDALDAVGDAATSAANSTRGAVVGAKDAVVNTASTVAHDVKDVVVGAKDAVVHTTSGVAHSVADGVSSAAHGVTNVASGVVQGVGHAASGLAHGVTNVASNVVEGTKDVVTGAAEKVSDIAHSAKDVVGRVLSGGDGGPETRYGWDSRDGVRGERGERLHDSFDRTKEHVRGYASPPDKHSDFLSHLGHTGDAAGGTGGGGKLDEMAARAESTQRDVRRTAQEMASSVGKPELARHAESVTADVKRTARETAAAMEEATDNLKDRAAKAKFVASHVAGDVKDKAGHIADDVKGKVVDAKDKVADAATDAKDRVKGAAIDVKDRVKDAAVDVKDRVASKTDEIKRDVSSRAQDVKRDLADAKRDVEHRAASAAAPLSPAVEREMRANARTGGDAAGKELDTKTESKTSSGPSTELKKALSGTSEVRRNVGTPSRNEPSDTTPSREATADTRRDMRKDVRDMAWVSRDREGVQWDSVGEHPHHGHHADGDTSRGYENAKVAVSGSTTPSADPSRTPQRAPSPTKDPYDRDRSWAAATESADLSRTRRMDGTVDRSTLMVLKREEERLHQLADKAHEEADRKHKEADRALEASIPNRFPARGEPRGLFSIDAGKRRDEEHSAPLLTDERFAHLPPGQRWDRTHIAPGLPGDRTPLPSDMQRDQDYMFRAEDRKYAADADLSGGNEPPSERRGVWDRLKDAAANVRASVQP